MFSCNSSCIILRVTNEPNTVSVEKVWSDNGHENERPESIQVQLYCQEEGSSERTPYGDPVTLSAAENQWTHTWESLDETCIWTVEEVRVPAKYTTDVSGNATDGFVITNTYVTETETTPETQPAPPETEPTPPETQPPKRTSYSPGDRDVEIPDDEVPLAAPGDPGTHDPSGIMSALTAFITSAAAMLAMIFGKKRRH